MSGYECTRCGCVNSVFWYPWKFCDRFYYLCDDCQKDLAKWISEGKKDE